MSDYYREKLPQLRDIFGSENISLRESSLIVDDREYPIIDDVIVLLAPENFPARLRRHREERDDERGRGDEARAVQRTFGAEWSLYPDILPEHRQEFDLYFDLVAPEALAGKRVCDMGCGIGRWSYFLRHSARELVLIDFSEAIFVARRNLSDTDNAILFLADLTALPFRPDCMDFVFSLGVLHHLARPALDEVRNLSRLGPAALIYLYSALDGRPPHFRAIFFVVDGIRRVTSRISNPAFRTAFTWLGTLGVYLPLIWLGHLVRPLRLDRYVPLYDFYRRKSIERIRQDVYDRFFTPIEQRVTRRQILELSDTFGSVTVSDQIPYWHFLCERKARA